MSVKILIPASVLIGLKREPLTLKLTQRCSRCDRSPAEFYEVHRLFFRAGSKRNRLIGKKYELSKKYQLRINICETCYQTDFLTHPETLDDNGSILGTVAKLQSVAWTMGAFFAAFGFLLLTPLISETGFLSSLKSIWQLPVALGVIILLLTWLSQKKYQNRIIRTLKISDSGFRSNKRAVVNTPVLSNLTDLSITALEIKMDNELWATEVATKNGWLFEKTMTPAKEIKNPEE